MSKKKSHEIIKEYLRDPESQAYLARRQAEIDLAVKIKTHRERLGLSQRQLAAKMGVPQPTIVRMESGESSINSFTLEKFCLVAGLELNFTPKQQQRNVIELAEYVLLRCHEILNLNYDITILKLLKLLYYIQVKFLVDHNKPFFSHRFEAWDRGPVHVDVYNHFSNPIEPARILLPQKKEFIFNESEKELVDYILFVFDGGLAYKSAYQLVAKTHGEAPWRDARKKGNNVIISTESIIKYYKNRI